MNADQIQGLIGLLVAWGLLVLMILPPAIGAVREWHIDRRIRRAQQEHAGQESRTAHTPPWRGQKSSSRATAPSTATWYADTRRSKKLVSS
ncbi:hypothetical protein [Streptomyces thermodiastaticus]|uniref:hypothetical protein n=1 Tax=Streptomyces thermodiastaticus TaxID=44061 RepID=UPI00167846B1|nr:hypothetical protein [Streptomyces thermodiastaticus]MCE7549866.1 hypothetical protein [Streptomyces thermodiastaticus]GHF65590.1 hypothetical protein GCM10018787_12300 [Streptomyces thermodiastaticus]